MVILGHPKLEKIWPILAKIREGLAIPDFEGAQGHLRFWMILGRVRPKTTHSDSEGVGELSALVPAQNRLGQFCGPQRVPDGALWDGAEAGLCVDF